MLPDDLSKAAWLHFILNDCDSEKKKKNQELGKARERLQSVNNSEVASISRVGVLITF